MNARTRTILFRALALLALVAMLPSGVGNAQRPEPPPPAAPFDAVGMPVTADAPQLSPRTPPIGDAFATGGSRLVDMQAWDGGWGWELDPPTAPVHSPMNTIAPIAMGLGKAYEHGPTATMEDALEAAGDYLMNREDVDGLGDPIPQSQDHLFSPADGYIAGQLNDYFSVSTYTDYVFEYFYQPLADGTYDRWDVDLNAWDSNNPYDTAEYVNFIRARREGQGIPNLAAWDVGMGLVAADRVGAETGPWIEGVKAEINQLDGDLYYDVVGLAGALYGLCVEDVSFDPTSGEHALANSTDGLFTILLSYQLATGGWTWSSTAMNEGEDNETIQESAYSVLALNCRNRDTYLSPIIRGADYLESVQLVNGGWKDWALGTENNEVTGEALWALDAAYPLGTVWVCETGDCGHPDAYFNSIQDAIDSVNLEGEIFVFPGDYDETASDRILLSGNTSSGDFPYQFGLFFPENKPGISVIGVDEDGIPFTDANDPNLPYVTTNATNNFGPSNFWVEGDNVTIQGIRQGPNNSAYENKSIEVVADGFTLRYFKSEIPLGGASVYINDWLYDDDTDTSTVESFTVDSNIFDDGTSVDISSGVGVTGDVSGRIVTNNSFEYDPLVNAYWPGVSFNGDGTGVEWFVGPVGGAIVTGNSFSGSEQYIRSRGIVEESDFDWDSYWNDNTFDKKVMTVASTTPPLQPVPYTYMSGSYTMINTKHISALIQHDIDHAVAGNTVLVGPGVYPELLTIDEGITVLGAGATFSGALVSTNSAIVGTSFGAPDDCGNVVEITGLTGDTTIEGFDILTGDYNSGIHFAGGTDPAGHVRVLDNHIIGTNNSLCEDDLGDPQSYQYGVIGGYLDVRSVVVSGNEISNTYDNSILMELQMGASEISGNTFNGGFPSVFYMTYDGHDVMPLQKVSANTFEMIAAEVGSGAAGVGVNPSTYYVDLARRTGKYADFEISGNTFTGISDVSIKAISVGENSEFGVLGGFDNLDIFGNNISGTDGKGIQFFGHITNADVYDNVITGLYQGLKMFTYQSSFWPENNDIYYNQISGASNKLAYWDGPGTINMEENWWGSGLGPKAADNTYGVGSGVSVGVDYRTWCGNITCSLQLPAVNVNDYDADGKTDPALFEKATGHWFVQGSNAGYFTPALNFGNGTDYRLVPGDYDGDGQTDVALFEKATGHWFVVASMQGYFTPALNFGNDTDFVLVPGDYDGDGKWDPAVFHKATGNWFALGSTAGFIMPALGFGNGTDYIAVPADYDGDGTTDPAVYETATGNWFAIGSTDGFMTPALGFGDATFLPVPGDYDGDGATDAAVFGKVSGDWVVMGSTDGFFFASTGFGNDALFIAVPGDYDGDAKVDPAVFERAAGNWFVDGSTVGVFNAALSFGNETLFSTATKPAGVLVP